MKIPEELNDYINDYEMKVFEIAWLTEAEIDRFHSDFKIVASKFLCSEVMVTVMAMDTVTAMVMATGTKRKNKNYIPDDPTEIRHVDEVLKLLQVMTGDERYQMIFNRKKGVHSMCDVAERLEKMGIEKGLKQGIGEGIKQGIEQGIERGIELGKTAGIHAEKVRVYKRLIEKGFSEKEAREIAELPETLNV